MHHPAPAFRPAVSRAPNGGQKKPARFAPRQPRARTQHDHHRHHTQHAPRSTAPASDGRYRKAAGKGLRDAKFRVGQMYHKGRGVAADLKEAAKWYTEATQQSHTNAMTILAAMYVPSDVS